jgi:signal transduction histidine kinase
LNAALPVLAAAAAVAAFFWFRARARARDLDRQLHEARDHLDRTAHASQQFFDLVTHEVRSPITAIVGYQELLRDGAYGALPDAAQEPLERVGQSAHHLLHLVDGVIELARFRSGTLRPHLDTVDLRPLLAAVADAFRGHALQRHLQHDVHLPPDLPTIRSDPERLLRALDLLIVSAVKHPAADGTLELHVQPEPRGVTVRLRGVDLTPQHPDSERALRFGLRIAIANGLALALGGRLDLDTRDGRLRGVAFRIHDASASPV